MSGDNTTNNNKNIILAVALAVITSLTSLGTALISKESESTKSLNEAIEKLKEANKNLKTDLQKNISSSIEDLKKDYSSTFLALSTKVADIKKETLDASAVINKENQKSLTSISKSVVAIKSDVTNISKNMDKLEKRVEKNTVRSVMSYSALSRSEVKKSKYNISVIKEEKESMKKGTVVMGKKANVPVFIDGLQRYEGTGHLDKDLMTMD